MADIRFKDLDEAASPGADYWVPTDSATDGVKKIKPHNLVKPILGTANEITVTNGNGEAGNPTISLPAAITMSAKVVTGGEYVTPTLTGPDINGGTLSGSVIDTSTYNGNTWTAGSGILTIAAGKTLTASNDANVSGTNTGDQTITLTGDVTGTGTGSFAATIGATKVTSSMLNSDVFSTAHSWSGVQTFTNPVVGTQTAGDNSTKAASTAFVTAAVSASVAGVASINGQTGALTLSFDTQARVTLTSGVAVTESDVTGATSVYVTPAGHNLSPIYDGTNDVPRSYTERTITLDSTNVLAGGNYDVFLAYSGGSVVAGYGPDWSNGAVPGSNGAGADRGSGAGSTEIEVFNGRLVNKNSITIRSDDSTTYTIAARQANLVGGFRGTSNGMTEDSVLKRLVWSILAAPRMGKVNDATTSWAYSTAAFRQMHGSTSNQFEYLAGLGGKSIYADLVLFADSSTSTGRPVAAGIGIDSTSVNSATVTVGLFVDNTVAKAVLAKFTGSPGIGYHAIIPLEYGGGSDTQTWYGSNPPFFKSGLLVEIEL